MPQLSGVLGRNTLGRNENVVQSHDDCGATI